MSLRTLLETTVWAVVSTGVWLVTLSGVTVPELCFAVGAGIACGVAATVARRSLGGHWRLRPRWLLWTFPVAATLLAEVPALFWMAVRGPSGGELSQIRLPEEDVELAAGREAAATLALCSTPGAIVADNDPDEHVLTVHRLLSAGPDLSEVVRR